MKINDKLSICIPTYNRADFIGYALDSFIPQVSKYNIPIYISNNASIDNTVEVLEYYKSNKYKHIYFKSNESNVGFDKNLMSVINMSSSEFCWIFGDDDVIYENIIDKIIEYLNNDISLLIINASIYNKDLSKKIQDKIININSDKTLEAFQYEYLFDNFCNEMTFIGSLIIKRERFLSVNYYNYISSDFIHVYGVFSYIVKENKPIIILSNTYVKIRAENYLWTKRIFEVWSKNWPNAINSLDESNYSSILKKKVIDKNYFNSFIKKDILSLLRYKLDNIYNFRIYNEYIKNDKDINKKLKFILLIISIIPNNKIIIYINIFLYRSILFIYKKLF